MGLSRAVLRSVNPLAYIYAQMCVPPTLRRDEFGRLVCLVSGNKGNDLAHDSNGRSLAGSDARKKRQKISSTKTHCHSRCSWADWYNKFSPHLWIGIKDIIAYLQKNTKQKKLSPLPKLYMAATWIFLTHDWRTSDISRRMWNSRLLSFIFGSLGILTLVLALIHFLELNQGHIRHLGQSPNIPQEELEIREKSFGMPNFAKMLTDNGWKGIAEVTVGSAASIYFTFGPVSIVSGRLDWLGVFREPSSLLWRISQDVLITPINPLNRRGTLWNYADHLAGISMTQELSLPKANTTCFTSRSRIFAIDRRRRRVMDRESLLL